MFSFIYVYISLSPLDSLCGPRPPLDFFTLSQTPSNNFSRLLHGTEILSLELFQGNYNLGFPMPNSDFNTPYPPTHPYELPFFSLLFLRPPPKNGNVPSSPLLPKGVYSSVVKFKKERKKTVGGIEKGEKKTGRVLGEGRKKERKGKKKKDFGHPKLSFFCFTVPGLKIIIKRRRKTLPPNAFQIV